MYQVYEFVETTIILAKIHPLGLPRASKETKKMTTVSSTTGIHIYTYFEYTIERRKKKKVTFSYKIVVHLSTIVSSSLQANGDTIRTARCMGFILYTTRMK